MCIHACKKDYIKTKHWHDAKKNDDLSERSVYLKHGCYKTWLGNPANFKEITL